MTANSSDSRVEATLAHQERQIQDLSDMISQQWKQIEILKARLDRAQNRIEALESAAGRTGIGALPASEKPPHY